MASIITYFSRNGENYVSSAIKDLKVGNTEIVAGIIQKLTGADLFKLEPVKEYSKDHNECIAQAQADQRRDARPELKSYPESLDEYDTIYLGYPNYWGTMPMCMFTFLEHFDFSGKTIKPLCTHEGSGMAIARRMGYGKKDEIANVAELLMSDKGAFITGSTFLIDGGATSGYFYGPLKPQGYRQV